MAYRGLGKGLSKEDSLELGFEHRVGQISQSGRQRIERSPKYFKLRFGMFKAFRLWIRGCVMFDIRRAKLKNKREVYCQIDSTQQLLSSTRSRIVREAREVHLTVVLCDLAYAFSEQAVLHCSDHSAVDLSVPQADRPTLSCSNQGKMLSKGRQVCKSAF